MTNISLTRPSGSEVWTHLVSKKLVELGANVTVFSPEVGQFGDQFGHVTLVSDAPTYSWKNNILTKEPFDLAIFNHTTCANLCSCSAINGERIKVIHGIRPAEEQPDIRSFTKSVAVSEEVADFVKTTYGLKVDEIIYNPVDNDLFKLDNKKEVPTTMLWACHKNGMQTPSPICYESIQDHNLHLLYYSTQDYPTTWMFKKADLVIGEARSIYQAMAAKRPVIISNGWTVSGVLTPEIYVNAIKYNCTIRCPQHPSIILNHNNLSDLIDLANSVPDDQLNELRDLATLNHSVDSIVDKLLILGEVT